jgi:DNA-binding CsgD family transcriptional regulator
MYAIAARVNAVLSNLVLQEYDDENLQLKYSTVAVQDAARAGDVPTLRTALLQNLSAHIRTADDDAVEDDLGRLSEIPLDDAANDLILFFRAVALSWRGNFAEAHALMAVCWERPYLDIDRIAAGAQLSLFLALDDKRDASTEVAVQVRRLLRGAVHKGPFRSRAIAISIAHLALGEALNGRVTSARRLLHRLSSHDPVESSSRLATDAIASACEGNAVEDKVTKALKQLELAGYRDTARMLNAAYHIVVNKPKLQSARGNLTRSELEVLRMLSHGVVAKEIALDTARSINTVRAHIASAVRKLGCNRQSEAIKVAKKLNVL